MQPMLVKMSGVTFADRFNYVGGRDEPVQNPFIDALLQDNANPADPMDQDVQLNWDYSSARYQLLMSFLRRKIDLGNYTYKDVTKWAGYSGTRGSRDFQTMSKQSYRNKSAKWNSLMESLQQKNLLRDFATYEGQQEAA